MLLYIGPGIGAGTFALVGLVLAIVVASLVVVLIRPIKRLLSGNKEEENKDDE